MFVWGLLLRQGDTSCDAVHAFGSDKTVPRTQEKPWKMVLFSRTLEKTWNFKKLVKNGLKTLEF